MMLTGHGQVCTYSDCTYNYLSFNANGDIFPCDRPLDDRYRVGNLGDGEDIIDIFNSKNYMNYVKEIEEKNDLYCQHCEIVDLCNGGCHMVHIDATGTAAKPNRGYCAKLKKLLAATYDELAKIPPGDIAKLNPILKDILLEQKAYLPSEVASYCREKGVCTDIVGKKDAEVNYMGTTEYRLFRAMNDFGTACLGCACGKPEAARAKPGEDGFGEMRKAEMDEKLMGVYKKEMEKMEKARTCNGATGGSDE